MNSKLKLILVALALGTAVESMRAQGTAFTYQGCLNSAGAATSGTYDFTFALFATNSGGMAVAGPVTNTAIAVTNGLFISLVDFGPQFTGSSNWLEIAVRTNGGGAFTTLAPRQQLTPVPYAVTAAGLSGGISAGQITSGIISTSVISGFQGPGYIAIDGGQNNTASGNYAAVGGGYNNMAANSATVAGGINNSATGNFGAIAGGGGNSAAYSAAVGGGANNAAGGYFSAIPGGANNTANGKYSLAAGQQAQALHQGAFVWADSQPAAFSSVTNDQFLIRAQNGVGIGTNATGSNALTVAGTVAAVAFKGSGAGVTNVNAGTLTGTLPSTAIGAGSITGSMLGTGAAAANLAAQNETAVPSGGVVLSASGGVQEQNLLNAGYVKIGTATLVQENWVTNLASGPAATGELTVGRVGHTAVWTGSEWIIWGGYDEPDPTFSTSIQTYNNGEIYNPSVNTWTVINPNSGLSPRYSHVAVWTGTRMVVWGGDDGYGNALGDGASYNPTTDSWTPVSTVNAPIGREAATAVWTGSGMIVWGGFTNYVESGLGSQEVPMLSGGIYNPTLNNWTTMSTSGVPAQCIGHTAVWTGTYMVVFGGAADNEGFLPFSFSGGRYNPANNTWSAMSSSGAPGPVLFHSAVWDGTNMIVFGGCLGINNGPTNEAGSYNPVNNTWASISSVGIPSPRYLHSAVWTGTQMIVWGGGDPFNQIDDGDGAIYTPAANSWTALPSGAAPEARDSHSAVWTGSEMLIWGGETIDPDTLAVNYPEPGGYYNLVFNYWSPISDAPRTGEPGARQYASAVWTGSEMLIWGGENSGFSLQTGGQFDPVANNWTPITISNAPSARQGHSAVWTGKSMVVWGGENSGVTDNSGGRYNPVSGTWAPTSSTNAPSSRASHVAVWDGTEMLVWGGYESTLLLPSDGGRYNPVTDTWVPINTTNEPAPASQSAAVWDGNGMIVWGGNAGNGLGAAYTSAGGIYYPATDSWAALPTSNAPSPRVGHTAVWSGTDYIVYGGSNGTNTLNTGGRFTLSSNSWAPLPLTNTLPALSGHSAVWTGNKMIIVGGMVTNGTYNRYLELYDTAQNSWTTSLQIPSVFYGGFANGCAVWTGSGVLIWGGFGNYPNDGVSLYYDTPEIYVPQQTMDLLLRP